MWIGIVIFSGIVGLAATSAAGYMVWYIRQQWKQEQRTTGHQVPLMRVAGKLFVKWTWFDVVMLLLLAFGLIFQAADLAAVMRDRALFPPYHFAYVWCGFIFTFMGTLFMLIRLFAVLLITGSANGSFLPHHHHEPNHANHAEDRV